MKLFGKLNDYPAQNVLQIEPAEERNNNNNIGYESQVKLNFELKKAE